MGNQNSNVSGTWFLNAVVLVLTTVILVTLRQALRGDEARALTHRSLLLGVGGYLVAVVVGLVALALAVRAGKKGGWSPAPVVATAWAVVNAGFILYGLVAAAIALSRGM